MRFSVPVNIYSVMLGQSTTEEEERIKRSEGKGKKITDFYWFISKSIIFLSCWDRVELKEEERIKRTKGKCMQR